MRALALTLLLTACAEEPTIPAPTWRDAAQEVAYGQCSRWIECGTETELSWQECVNELVYDFCERVAEETSWRIRCGDPYSGSFDEIARCSMWYAQVTCGQYVEQCTL